MASLAYYKRQLAQLGNKLEREGLLRIQTAVGTQARADVDAAVKATPVKAGRSLADQQMSGFKAQGIATPIDARYDIKGDSIRIYPQGNKAGRMSILESGTKAYAAGDQRLRKRYKSKKTGEVKLRMQTVHRGRKAQPGKGTWTRASAQITETYAKVAADTLQRILFEIWGNG